jgi:hypothetical protein
MSTSKELRYGEAPKSPGDRHSGDIAKMQASIKHLQGQIADNKYLISIDRARDQRLVKMQWKQLAVMTLCQEMHTQATIDLHLSQKEKMLRRKQTR